MSMTHKENHLRTIRFEHPEYIPMNFHINDACWNQYPQDALFDLMEGHPFLFPGFVRPKVPYVPNYILCARKDEPYVDDFGCLWETSMDGITGTVTRHPLADWDNYQNYKLPDPNVCMGIGPINWEETAANIKRAKAAGQFTSGGLRHGHTFLQICDIHGYQNVLFDMEDEEPMLEKLLEDVTDFNVQIIEKYAALDVDMMSYGEDLGMQVGPMLSPEKFDQYIIPCYRRLLKPAQDKGILIHMHSDGDIRTLVPSLVQCGYDVLNLQDLVNGIDWIRDNMKGKTCIELDIDRQAVTPYGTPAQIDALIREEVEKLGSKEGGLMMVYGLYPGVPLENAKAVMDAMEKYAFYYN